MKIRSGFVSNSSSSSFIVPKNCLNETQINLIVNHNKTELPYAHQAWKIQETETELSGSTWMNNFDMRQFMKDIGVPMDYVTWDGNDLENLMAGN